MPDDLSLIVGEIRGSTRALVDRVDRSDEQTDRKFQELAMQHERDKQAAILAREAKEARDDIKHEENKGAIETVRTEVRTLTVQASDSQKWIEKYGTPTVATVNGMVEAEKLKKSRAAGAAAVWGMIGATVTLVIGAAGTLASIGPDGIKAVSEMLSRHH